MLLQACLNGSRSPDEHSALPLAPEALAHDAQLVVAAGVQALHIHPRDADGRQSLAASDQAAALSAIRRLCPSIPIGVSTAIWIEPDATLRMRRVQQWSILPDFASVNFDEPGVLELCQALLERGIGVEAGLSHASQVELLRQSDLGTRCLRILIEPTEEELQAAMATTSAIIQALDAAQIELPRLLHGYEATAWPLLEVALRYRYDTRIGLEDTLLLPNGRLARDNAQLVSLAISKARQSGTL